MALDKTYFNQLLSENYSTDSDYLKRVAAQRKPLPTKKKPKEKPKVQKEESEQIDEISLDQIDIKDHEAKAKWHRERFGNPKIKNASLAKAGVHQFRAELLKPMKKKD